MSHDQCPSTRKGEKRKPGKAERQAEARPLTAAVSGRKAWRSVEEYADAPEFREWLEREFPSGMAELVTREAVDLSEAAGGVATLDSKAATGKGGESRRDFLKIMGASLALAGAATIPGCRRPDHKILSYSREVPEEIIPGKPLFYATSMPISGGGAEGLLVETHEGRPTKIEGNPLHPLNRGKASSWSLASILALYDPDRLKFPVYKNPERGRVAASYDDFRAWWGTHKNSHVGTSGDRGRGLAVIAEKALSPTRERARAAFLARYPEATWVWWTPMAGTARVEGTRLAFGQPMREVLSFSKEKTRVVLSLDRDFVHREAEELANARAFAKTREVFTPQDEMSRLYVVESAMSLTGGMADHRLRMSPGKVASFAVELAKFMAPRLGDAGAAALAQALGAVKAQGLSGPERAMLEACGNDLLDAANRGKTLIVAGETQSPGVHAVVAALNAALGNVGQSVSYLPMTAAEAASPVADLAALCEKMRAGTVRTLVCMNANPVLDAPSDLGFAELFAKVEATISLSVGPTETSSASTWELNGTHYLESWGDTRAFDGTIAPVQPMIAPLYEPAMSEIELAALLAAEDATARVDGYELVRATWRETLSGGDFERTWRRALHNGVVEGTAQTPTAPRCDFARVASAAAAISIPADATDKALDVVVALGPVHDGRYSNISWLHELPDVATRVVWDNPILLSPATAAALGVLPKGYSQRDPNTMYTREAYPAGRVATLSVGGKSVTGACWICPGMADNTAIVTVGYGRRVCGKVGEGVGFDAYPLRTTAMSASGGFVGHGATLTPGDGWHEISSTQNHWSMESRTTLVRVVDLPAWKKFGGEVQEWVDRYYGTQTKLNFAERLGELSHTPPNESIYVNPYNRSRNEPDPTNKAPDPTYALGREAPPRFATRPQWAMTIDQTVCTGCGVCTIACQSENNIPVVGKKEVAKGREMSWIRVDRYFTGDDINNPGEMLHQPVACVHCENAPCETVCPVNATVHGPEGLNYMTYNRCIGTRYCANNCPYKVRRYNYFEYGISKFNGDYYGKEFVESIAPDRGGVNGSGEHNKINVNLIPPRLREKIDEISRMGKNPDVSVRMRGVMEKCSFCVQRINAARVETKLKGMANIPDGFFEAACQQACPSNAIVFGDMLDPESRVHATRGNARSYQLLNYLNTRPRTSHMLRVMNPNPVLCDAERKHAWDNPFHGPSQGSEGHGGAPEGGSSGGHSFRYEPGKKRGDAGYALSLNVLNQVNA